MYKPNLLIIGAQKSGTTWLHKKLEVHPQVFMSAKKELEYFTGKAKDLLEENLEVYFNNFSENKKIIGESTPSYFWNWSSNKILLKQRIKIPANIVQVLGEDLKVIVILRHPVFRAISAYFHHVKMGRINSSKGFFSNEIDKNFIENLIDMGFYSKHLKIWKNHLKRENILILKYSDIINKNNLLIQKLEDFLKISEIEKENFWDVIHKGSEFNLIEDKLKIDVSEKNTNFLNNFRKKNIDINLSNIFVSTQDVQKLNLIYQNEIEKFFGGKLFSLNDYYEHRV